MAVFTGYSSISRCIAHYNNVIYESSGYLRCAKYICIEEYIHPSGDNEEREKESAFVLSGSGLGKCPCEL